MLVQPSLRGCGASTCECAEAPPTLVGGRKPTEGETEYRSIYAGEAQHCASLEQGHQDNYSDERKD